MNDTISIILAIIGSGAFSSAVSAICSAWLKKKEGNSKMAQAVMLLLYDKIRYLCQCFIADECISVSDLEVLMQMHETYHQLGGNGYLDTLMSKVKSLPLKEDKK